MPPHPAPAAPRSTRGTLFIVATPIGNLDDITLRAIRVLREVDLIAAEDTRHTAKLLSRHGIATPMLSLHEHNERGRIERLMALVAEGRSVALVSDAGTPLVSDPGADLVAAMRNAGVTVIPVPGPSAVLTALVGSGLASGEFSFLGFPPKQTSARLTWLQRAAAEPRTLVIFEAPHRLRQTLADMVGPFGDRHLALCRELTKIHEEFTTGTAAALLEQVIDPRGECVLVAAAVNDDALATEATLPSGRELYLEFCRITESGSGRRDAVSALARRFGQPARVIYKLVEEGRGAERD